MKKLLKIIGTVSILFFTFSSTHASEGYIEKLLDLNIGVEEYDLELSYIDNLYFADYRTQELFEEFKRVNRLLKDEIIKKYRSGDFEYYQTKSIITNQKNFVYHTNRLFMYINLKEQNPNNREIDDFILKNYSLSRVYYNRVKNIIR